MDKIGVQITYQYDGVTPLALAADFPRRAAAQRYSWTFSKQNESRMEPVL